MTDEVKYCYEDDDTNAVARNMADIQVRRLPVLTREKRLVGIISLGDHGGERQGGEGRCRRSRHLAAGWAAQPDRRSPALSRGTARSA